MSDLKLFRVSNGQVREIEGHSSAIEKSLQELMERHCEEFLGVQFLASEYSTGRKHGGRIDSLGIDENGCPVIIEYKRSINENVINQGLFYLDWLLDHKAEFELLVMKQLGKEKADGIDWLGPRLLCIAGDFTRYDEHAVTQINRNIELLRYRHYGDELLLLELVNTISSHSVTSDDKAKSKRSKSKTVSEYLEAAPKSLQDLYEETQAFLLSLGDDVQLKTVKNYFAFRRLKNFACVEVHPQTQRLLVYIKVNPDSVQLEEGFTRDVRNIGHFGTGDLEVSINQLADLERAQSLFIRSYEAS